MKIAVKKSKANNRCLFQGSASCLIMANILLVLIGFSMGFSAPVLALEGDGEAPVSAPGENEALITMDFKEADIRNVLRIISYESGVNIISGPDVQGTISVRVADAPWKEALKAILKVNGFDYVQEGNIIRVSTIEKLKDEELQTQTYFLNFATASVIETSLKEVLSERGSMSSDARTNALVITDIPSRLATVVEIINSLDAETLQVAIEARIVEISLSKSQQMGINWGTVLSATGAQRPTIWPFQTESTNSVNPDNFPAVGADSIGGITDPFKFGILNATGFSAVLEFIQGETDSNTLQAPRITTLNNQEATITSGTQYPIPEYSYNSDNGQWEVTGFEYLDLGVTLTVTPNVNRNGYILMKVHPSIKKIGDNVSFGDANIPQYTTRETETQVMIKDGETIVIGGLMENKKQVDISKVPILGDIPILGFFFSRKTGTKANNAKTELLIFITAHIVKPGELEESQAAALRYTRMNEADKIKDVAIKTFSELGKSYYKQKEYPEAIEEFRKVLALDSAHKESHKYLQKIQKRLEKEIK